MPALCFSVSNLRFWYQGVLQAGGEVNLPDDLSHRLKHVLRLAAGQSIWLFNGSGVEYQAKLHLAQGSKCFSAAIINTRPANVASPLTIHLVQAIAKRDKMDWIIQKASELGVYSFTPLVTERVEAKGSDKRGEHWRSVAIAAAEQTQRDLPLEVRATTSFKEFLASSIGGTIILLEPSATLSMATWLNTITPIDELTILVGPEGGWSEAEIALAKAASCQVLQLGPRILRTETASIVAATLLQAAFGDLK